MASQDRISTILANLHRSSPAGFAIGLHVRFSTPRYMLQSYSQKWLDAYTRQGLVLHDPVVRWGFENSGATRWSDLADIDDHGVMAKAAAHGLRYGVVMSLTRKESRSMAGFARSDREMTDDEIAGITARLTELHDLTQGAETLSPDVHMTLKQMSIYLTHG